MRTYFSHRSFTHPTGGTHHNPRHRRDSTTPGPRPGRTRRQAKKDGFEEFCRQQEHRLFVQLQVTMPFGKSHHTAGQRELERLDRWQRRNVLRTPDAELDFEHRV